MDGFLSKDEILYLNHLVAELYNGKSKEETFKLFLKGISNLVYFEKGEIYFYRYEYGNVIFEDFITLEWSEADVNSYQNANTIKKDDNLKLIAKGNPLVYRYSDIFNLNDMKKSEYYHEVICPFGFHNSVEGNIMIDSDGSIGGIGIHRSKGKQDFSLKTLEVIKFARPHLMNIARKFRDIGNSTVGDYKRFAALTESFGVVGICIWDHELQLLSSNLMDAFSIDAEENDQMLAELNNFLKENRKSFYLEKKIPSKLVIHNHVYFANFALLPSTSDQTPKYTAIIHSFSLLFSDFLCSLKESHGLTSRELEVLNSVVQGFNNQEISKMLFISPSTVKKHLAQIYEKLGIEGKHQLLKLIT